MPPCRGGLAATASAAACERRVSQGQPHRKSGPPPFDKSEFPLVSAAPIIAGNRITLDHAPIEAQLGRSQLKAHLAKGLPFLSMHASVKLKRMAKNIG